VVLKLLQGPIVCTADPDDEDTAGNDVLLRANTCFWLDDHAICGYSEVGGYGTRAGPGSVIVFNLDGVFYVRRKTENAVNVIDSGWDYVTESGIVAFGAAALEYPFEPWTGSYVESQALTASNDWDGDNLIRLPDRFLTWDYAASFNDDEIASSLLDEDENDLVLEYTFSPSVPALGTDKRMMPGRDSLLYFYCHDAVSTIITYDFQKRMEISPRRELGVTSETVLYSPRFDIFISMHDNSGNQEIRIWANEFEVNALSPPIALTPVTDGQVSVIQTTLTDDQGQGVPDRLIDWSITSGNGSLIGPTAPQSTTNANGVAEILYRCLLSGGSDPTIEASVTF